MLTNGWQSPVFPALAMEMENSGARGVDLSIVQKIERHNLFASAHTAMPLEDWLEQLNSDRLQGIWNR